MAAVIGALRAELTVDVATFEEDLGKAEQAVANFGRRCETIGRNLQITGIAMTAALTAPLLAFAGVASKTARTADQALGQMEARLQSMGGASGRTSEQLQQATRDLRAMSTYGRTEIMEGVTNNLLTFNRVSGQVFDRAQRAAVNFAAGSKRSLQEASRVIGQALNDPIKGMNALASAGIAFTRQQQDQIKALVASGRGVEAQNIILAEFERRYEGAAQAMRDADPNAAMGNAWEDFRTTVGQIVNSLLPPLTAFLQQVADAFNNLSPGMQRAVVIGGAVVAAMGPVLTIIGQLVSLIGTLTPLWQGMAAGMAEAMAGAGVTSWATAIRALTVSLGAIIGVVIAVVAAAWEFRYAVIDAVMAVVDYFRDNVVPVFMETMGKLSALFSKVESGPIGQALRFIGWIVAEVVGILVQVLGVVAAAAINSFLKLLGGAADLIGGILDAIAALLRGDFVGAWEAAKDGVAGALAGIIGAIDQWFPGFEGALKAIWESVKAWIADGIAALLDWINAKFPGLVTAVRNAAAGAVAWARNLYNGIKTWIGDNLGPLIQWAKDRIAELNGLFAWIKGRQQTASGAGRQQAAPPSARDTAPPAAAGGGGGGGGDTEFPTGAPRRGRNAGAAEARRLERARQRFAEGLRDLNDAISKGLEEQALPKATQRANALRRRIDDIREDAERAGVPVAAFADEIARLQSRIDELETAGLQKEAEKFRLEVEKSGRSVNAFARGGLPPLEAALQRVDDQYQSLRSSIEREIEENRVLAESNDTAREAMALLERQLGDLDRAHVAAADAARAQYQAEQELANLNAQREALATQQSIDDLRRGRGSGNAISSRMEELRALEEDLARQRLDAVIRLRELEAQRDAALRVGDQDEANRLVGLIALQQELYDLVSSTTAEQIAGATRVRDAFRTFVDNLGDSLATMISEWKGDLDGLRGIFRQLARELFIQPVTSKFAEGFGNFLKGFAGGFATGGHIPAGGWGIVGEAGPEPVYGGRTGLTVLPNHTLDGGGGGGTVVNQYITTPDADSFRKSRRQVAGDMKRAVNFA